MEALRKSYQLDETPTPQLPPAIEISKADSVVTIKPQLGGKGLLLDALKLKMKSNVEVKIKAAKDAWAQLDVDIGSDDGPNSQADCSYSQSIVTVRSNDESG